MELTYCEKFMQSITQIEGPQHAAILVPKDDKTLPSILTLGDYHYFDFFCDYCSNETGCLTLRSQSFFDSLDNFAKTEQITIDIFIEKWSEQIEKYTNRNYDKSVLYPIRNSFVKFRNLNKNLRFHFTNVRNAGQPGQTFMNEQHRYGDSLIIRFFKFFCQNLTDESANNTIIIKSYLTDPKIQNEIQEEDILDLLSNILQADSLEKYFKIPFIQKSSRAFHEFNQLSTPFQNAIYEYPIFPILPDYIKNLFQFVDDIKNKKPIFRKNYFIFSYDDLYYNSNFLNMSHFILVDVYTVSRILKNDKSGNKIIFAVVLQGSAHTNNIIQILASKFYSIQSVYNQISPKCLQKSADLKFSGITNKLYDDDDDDNTETTEKEWFEEKNFLKQSPVELAFIFSKSDFILQIVKKFSIKNLLSFRSSAGSSIFSLAIENNLEAVLNLLIKKLVNNNITTLERGLVNKAIIHRSFKCLETLLNLKYPPIEMIKIGHKKLNSLTLAIKNKYIEEVSLLCRYINDQYIFNDAKKYNIDDDSLEILDDFITRLEHQTSSRTTTSSDKD